MDLNFDFNENKKIKKEEILNLLNVENKNLLELMYLANDKRKTSEITYSKNIFIPLTEVCRNSCGYCTFKKDPTNPETIILKDKNQVIAELKKSETFNCKEALFTLGEQADEEKIVQKSLKEKSFESMVEYIYDICNETLNKTQLLPHTNCGVLNYEDMKLLKEVNVSMGMMLESSSKRLRSTIAHENSPGKDPVLRLKTIANAGKLKIPFTTGILIGIGETKEEIVDSLLEIKKLQEKYGHIQELIIQNFKRKPGIPMENKSEPSFLDMIRTVSVAKLLFDDLSIQVPPNLNHQTNQMFLLCGADDWGGVSPISHDYVNPESPWPEIHELKQLTNDEGFNLKERLAIYDKFMNNSYLNENLLTKALSLKNKLNS